MNSLEIQSLINAKEKRQFVLEERKKRIEEIEQNLNISFLEKSLRGFYYFIKRFILIAFSLLLFIISCVLLTNPELLISENYKREIVSSFQKNNLDQERDTYQKIIENASVEIFNNKTNYENSEQIEGIIKNSVIKTMEDKAKEDYKNLTLFIGFLLLTISLITFYIARLTKKLKQRNDLILQSDDIAQQIIDDYTLTLKEEKEELDILKKAYLSTSSHI